MPKRDNNEDSERRQMARKWTVENRIEKRLKYHDNYDNH